MTRSLSASRLGWQEPSGRCLFTHDALAGEVEFNRTQVTRGLQHLSFARMVLKEGNSVYPLSARYSPALRA
ncbi:hypothetical protein ACFWXA_29535 [Streptomyces atroolivaceus]|uniref:hypothetical protein n=1 Tax=Streptomyces atroolivaceus TaxID=66869 RepID=UPI003648CFF2